MPASVPPAVVLLTGAGDVPESGVLMRRELGGELRVVAPERAAGEGVDPVSPRSLDGYLAEVDAVVAGAREVGELAAASTFAGPVVLVTSNAYGAEWVRMHDRIAARYRSASHHLTGARNHNIHLAQPALVARAIREALAA